jgi:hypothetical protein
MKIRLLAAAAVVVSAVVHLVLWFDGARAEFVVGPAFMVNAVAGFAIAVALLTWRSWLSLFLAAGFGAATLAAFVVSATVGLFGVHEHWVGAAVWTAGLAEIAAIAAAVAGLVGRADAESARTGGLPAGELSVCAVSARAGRE